MHNLGWIKCVVIPFQCSKGLPMVEAVVLDRTNGISKHLVIKELFHQYQSNEHGMPYLFPIKHDRNR